MLLGGVSDMKQEEGGKEECWKGKKVMQGSGQLAGLKNKIKEWTLNKVHIEGRSDVENWRLWNRLSIAQQEDSTGS